MSENSENIETWEVLDRESIGKTKNVRNFAFTLYLDSAPSDWKERIETMHVKALWIYHDRDVKEDGTLKKPHYHVMIMWHNNTTFSFARKIAIEIGASNSYVKRILTASGYARYMCHLDNPEKYVYPIEDLHGMGGVDVTKLLPQRQDEKIDMLQTMLEVCREKNLNDYCAVVDYCLSCNRKWAELLLDIRYGRLIQDYVKCYYQTSNR